MGEHISDSSAAGPVHSPTDGPADPSVDDWLDSADLARLRARQVHPVPREELDLAAVRIGYREAMEALTSPCAEAVEATIAVAADGGGGNLRLRMLRHPTPRTVALHVHGGGWIMGSAAYTDHELQRFHDDLAATAVSLRYPLAPESPYPAAVNECTKALLHLLRHGLRQLGAGRLVISAESAGANVVLAALLRLARAPETQQLLNQVAAVSLLYGAFDLAMTASQRRADHGAVDAGFLEFVYDQYVPDELRRHPDVSPLRAVAADLAHLPPVLLTVGTHDPLIDDSVNLHARLLSVGVDSRLDVIAGAMHGFDFDPAYATATAEFHRRQSSWYLSHCDNSRKS